MPGPQLSTQSDRSSFTAFPGGTIPSTAVRFGCKWAIQDHVRYGAKALFAVLDIATGAVFAHCKPA
jgi:hypothetical protein